MAWFSWIKDRLPKQKTKEELDKHYEEIKLEKGDLLAMLIAAFISLILPLLAISGGIFLLLWLIFGR